MKHSKKKIIILLGAPGSGKGTQGELLADKLNLYYFETSKILEEKFTEKDGKAKSGFILIDNQKYSFKKEKELWEKGILCSPPFVTFLVIEKIKQLYQQGQSLVLSGSPRTVYEGEKLVPLLKKFYQKENVQVLLLEQKPATSIFRNTHRRICQLMRHPILHNKETVNLKNCPLDGSKLIKRKKLDDPETIKIRLKQYKERTIPLIELFKSQSLKINKINAEKSPVKVFQEILKVL